MKGLEWEGGYGAARKELGITASDELRTWANSSMAVQTKGVEGDVKNMPAVEKGTFDQEQPVRQADSHQAGRNARQASVKS